MREALQSLLGLSAPDLFDEIRKHSRNLALAQWEVAACLLAIEQSRAHSEAGFSSVCQCAEVRWGIASHTAAEMVRVARVLVTFPHLSAAIRDGRINWTKAREITRVITPESEAGWVKFARIHTTREVERRVVKSPRQWKKEQGPPRNLGDNGTGRSQHNGHQEGPTAPGVSNGVGREGNLPRRDVETTGAPDETRWGEGRRRPEETPPGGGASAPGRSAGSPGVEEQDLFGNTADGVSREKTDAVPCSERLGDEVSGAERKPVGRPTPTPSDGPAEGVGSREQPTLTPVPPSGRGDGGGTGEWSEGAPGPGRQQEPDDEGLGPEVPPELQRVGLRFMLTGVQLRTFELAATALKTRNRSLRRREDVLEEMCRLVLAGVGSSTSSRVRSTLVVYRDPATGADWVETDRGPLRVAREDLERVAAEGEVVHVARPEAEAGLPSEILERSHAPRSSRPDIQGILAPLPLAPARTPHAPARTPHAPDEAVGAAVQESAIQCGTDSPEEQVGSIAGASEQGAHLRLQVDRPREEPHPCRPSTVQPPHFRRQADIPEEEPRPCPPSTEQPLHLRLQADLPKEEPRPYPPGTEQPSTHRSRSSALAQGMPPCPAVSDPPSDSRNDTAGCVGIPESHGPCSCRRAPGGRRAPIPAATYRKLWLRSGGRCENPGCGRGGPLHVHHDDAWSDEHHHDPERMRLLCERCHALLHEDDFATRQEWASARAWSMSRRESSSPARDTGPPVPRGRREERLPGPGSRG